MTEITDFDGGKTAITYNRLNRPETITDREGRVTRRSYDRMWNMEKETLPSGAVASYHYDQDNRLSRVELCQGEGKEPERVFSYTHDPNGNLLKVTAGESATLKGNGEDSPAGESAEAQEEAALSITRYEYDALNRPVSVTDGEGNKTCYTYDERGNLASVTDPAGNTVTYRYNAAGEKTEERDGQGNTVTYEYSLLGQPVRITDPAGRATSHEYLPGGRLWKTVYPDGRTVSYTYDKNGNVKTRENSDGYILTYHYDCMNRITRITSSRGQSKAYTYDALGNVTAVTDTEGNTTSYEYTLSGKLSAVTDALGNRTEYRYDALDNLILIRQKGNAGEEDRVTEYLRDPLGQIRIMRDALGEEEQYVYDALGRVAQKTDRDGYVTTNTYYKSGKLASVLYGDGTGVEYSYDALQRLIRVKDWLGETTIQRDKTGNPERITDPEGREVSYEWGRLGEKKAVIYPDGKRVRYHYDEMLHLSAMDMEGEGAEGTGRISYQYDEMGRLARKQFPGGITTRWSYNETGLPSELLHEDGEGVLDRYQYTYDLGGNRTGIRRERRGLPEESGDYGYAYDPLGRLAQVSRNGSLLRSYRYDSFSNRTETEDHAEGRTYAFTYDARNRLTAMKDGAAGKEYVYDRRGNLTGEMEGGALIRGYAYGAMNRLARAWNGQGEEASYLYNGLGQRIGRARREGDRTLKDRYLLDQTRPYHNLLGIEREGDVQTFYYDGNVAAMEDGKNGFHYYLQDELGSPLRVSGYERKEGTESIGGSYAVQDYLTYGYDEFGNDLYRELEESGIPSPYDKQGEEQPFGYTGYRYDEVSGTYFAQAREYQSENGRFTAEDVVKGNGAVPETLNRYGYCWGNPVGFVDNNGEYPFWTVMGDYIGNTIRDLGGAVGNAIEEVSATMGNTVAQVYGSVGNAVSDISGSVGNMAQQVGTIFGSPKSAAVVGNLITGAGSYAGNEISDLGMEAGAVTKAVGTYTADDVRRNTAVGGMLAKEIIKDENINGTVTYGGNISGTLGVFVVDVSLGVSMDYKGNIGIQPTLAWGVTASSDASLTGSVFRTITNAPDIYELNENGGCIGASVLIPTDKIPVYIGGDLVIVGDLDNKPNEGYYGFTTALGTGIAANLAKANAEVHGEMSYTKTLWGPFNIFDLLIDALNESGCIE